LALDIGTNSIGWWIYELDQQNRPCRSLDAGVRIFSDGRNPKDQTSLASTRRLGRSQRKRRDRYLRRRAKLLRALIELGLLPSDETLRRALVNHDPYALRAAALDGALSLAEIGRALFHLNQRRGFKSNRKTDRADSERGVVRSGVNRLKEQMAAVAARSLGEFLYLRHQSGDWVRARKRPLPNDKGKLVPQYDIYPDRQMVEAEFDLIWDTQAAYHPAILTTAARRRLKDIIFFQRRLKPQEIGLCTFEHEARERRLYWADPLSQRRRVYEQANQLMIVPPGQAAIGLTKIQRDQVADALLANPRRTFIQLRRLLKLAPDHRFNLEDERRSDLKGDETAAVLGGDKYFGDQWCRLPLDAQRSIVSRLIEDEDEQQLAHWLQSTYGFDAERALAIALAPLPDGTAALGETASRKILAALERDVVVYSAAVQQAGYHHSDFRTGEILDELPYYGAWLPQAVKPGSNDPDDDDATRYGRVSNPTVHIALGQLRRLINGLMTRYGPPTQIVVELARELKASRKQREEMDKRLTANKQRADRHRQILTDLQQPETGENRLRLRLYDELEPLEHRCPYSGQQISLAMLFSHAIEIDHILPFSRSLDNRVDNRLLVLHDWNRRKGNATPYEAFGHGADWADIAARAEKLPSAKRRRFQPDAMEWFQKNEADFLDRHLVDTQYLSRLARQYLTAICDPNQVWAIPGGLTALIRGKWHLDSLLGDNAKNRNDHRHHAIDAAVVGLTDRGLLNAMARASAQAAERGELEQITVELPWPSLKDDMRAQLGRIIVSHKPEKGHPGDGRIGKFFKDTAYAIIGDPDKRGVPLVAHRVPLESLTTAEDLDAILAPEVRLALQRATAGKTGKDFTTALITLREAEGPLKGLRRVRIGERLSVIPVTDKQGRIYKAYASDGNYAFDIWRLPAKSGKDASVGKWVAEVVSLYNAAQGKLISAIKQQNPTAKKIMSLRQNDLVAIATREGRAIMRVVKFSTNGALQLAAHQEAGTLKARDADPDDYFKYLNSSASGLQKLAARKVRVTADGKIYDPGPLEKTAAQADDR
jgi:CRISPR-associated endonuclease Csn1